MTTKLAQQLQGIRQTASVNSFQKKKKVASLLFDFAEAADLDYDQVFAIANNGFEELLTFDPSLQAYGKNIFSEQSRSIDRYTQTKEQNDALDKTLRAFIIKASPHFLLRPLQKSLEWLIRRFDIHVHLSELLLSAFLPFHDSTTYTKLLAIIDLPQPWSFLGAVKKAKTAPSLVLFVKAFSKGHATLRVFLDHVQDAVRQNRSFHALISTYAEVSVRTISAMRDNGLPEENICEIFLPYVADALSLKAKTEYQIANYMVLTVLAATRSFNASATIAAMRSLCLGLTQASQKSGLLCLAQLTHAQEGIDQLSSDVYQALLSVQGCFTLMLDLAAKYCLTKLLTAFALSAIDEASTASVAQVKQIIESGSADVSPILAAISQKVLASADLPDFRIAIATLLQDLQVDPKYKKTLKLFNKSLGDKVADLELALQITLETPSSTNDTAKSRRLSSSQSTRTLDDDIADLVQLSDGETYLSVSDVRRSVNAFRAAINADSLEKFMQHPIIGDTKEHRLSFLVRAALSSHDVQTQLRALEELNEVCREACSFVDFQGLIPIAICLLSSKSQDVRQSAIALVETIVPQTADQTKRSIFGLDDLYGSKHSETLRWMSSAETQYLLQKILKLRADCVLDHKVIYRAIGEVLKPHGSKIKGKESSHQLAVLQFLASHIVSSPIAKIVLKLLLCFDRIPEPTAAKTKALFPLLEAVLSGKSSLVTQSEIELIDPVIIERLLFRQVVGSEHGRAVSLLLTQVKLQQDHFGALAIERLCSIFTSLTRDTQTELVRALVAAIIDAPLPVSRQARISIDSIDISTDLFGQMIDEIALSPPSSRQATPMKKQKKATVETPPDVNLRRFTHLLEVLEGHEKKHAALLPILFSKLEALVLIEAESAISVSYTEQILLSVMYAMVDPGKFDPTTCRIDILISCIRTSSSLQVHNRALLLIAALAEAAPEQVLHGVMPIFTFMGANILRQDDGFSAHVIESTIQRVVPPLLATLGDETENQILGAAGILRSFVDAFSHVPKHRRLNLFTVLLQTLGEDVFLAPLLALLAQKRIGTPSKNKSGDSQSSYLDFCLLLIRQFSVSTQLKSIHDLIGIARTVPENASQIPDHPLLLSYTIADDNYLDDLKMSLLTIIHSHFEASKVRLEFEASASAPAWADKDTFIGIVESLLKAIDQFGHSAESQEKALDALDRAATLLPVTLFEVVCCDFLQNKRDESLKLKTLEMITNRASSTDPAETSARAVFISLIGHAAGLLTRDSSPSLLCNSLQCISSLGRRFGKVDLSKFSQVAPLVIGDMGIKHSELIVQVAAIDCLTTIVVVLGPRVLPLLQNFMPAVLEGLTTASQDENADLVPLAAVSLLEALVKCIPTFMTPYTQTMLVRCADLSFATEELISDKRVLMTTIAQTMPTRNVLEALGGAWKTCIESGKKSLLAVVLAIEELIENTNRKVITGSAKEILALFLQALDIRKDCKDWDARAIEQVEKRIISVLLKVVLKMNDSTFRPLFLKLRDWAVSELADKDAAALQLRQITFFNFFTQFAATFKSIVLNYFNYVFEDICDLLHHASKDSTVSRRLWVGVISSLTNGFSSDTEEFWRNADKFDRLAPLLISHLSLTTTYPIIATLVPAIVEFTSASSTKEHCELINNQVLEHFKSDSAAIRLAAVTAENKLAAKMGEEWLFLLPKIIPYLYDALEDEDEQVEKQTHALAMTIEGYLGESLDPYLR